MVTQFQFPISKMAPLILLLLGLAYTALSIKVELYCPLVWQDYSFGDTIPSSAITATPNTLLVARIYDPLQDRYFIGAMELTTGMAHIHGDIYSAFQILTNPHDCDVEWTPAGKTLGRHLPLHSWPVGFHGNRTLNQYVGRAFLGSAQIPGNVDVKRGFIDFGDEPTFRSLFQQHGYLPSRMQSYQILRSFSSGLLEELSDFEFKSNLPTTNLDFIGLDEIRNNADVVVKVNVTFSYRQVEPWTIHNRANTEVSWLKVPTRPDPGPKPLEKPNWKDSASNETINEEVVTITREITVPPRTAIQACAAVKISTDLDNEFSATATVTGKGLTGDQIYELIKGEDPEFQGEILTHSVKAKVTGRYSAKRAVATRFIVLPVNAMSNCKIAASTAAKEMEELEREWKLIAERYEEEERNVRVRNPKAMEYRPEVKVDSRNVGVKMENRRR